MTTTGASLPVQHWARWLAGLAAFKLASFVLADGYLARDPTN